MQSHVRLGVFFENPQNAARRQSVNVHIVAIFAETTLKLNDQNIICYIGVCLTICEIRLKTLCAT